MTIAVEWDVKQKKTKKKRKKHKSFYRLIMEKNFKNINL